MRELSCDAIRGLPDRPGRRREQRARVACRTAGAVAADAVVALAPFPLHSPGRPRQGHGPTSCGRRGWDRAGG
ncbi:hypothetical protein [Nonomuraea dietziae]|uniref:hypothetical protein n=1 Tax=Nonomuraea dietziae TaxID=65515 RepID=UPI0031CE541C